MLSFYPGVYTVVTNEQLYSAIGIPLIANAALLGMVMLYRNARLKQLEERL